MDEHVRELCEPGELRRSLEKKVPAGRVAVALAAGGRVAATETAGGAGVDWAAPVGCIAKLLTASLACKSVERGRFALDTYVAALLGAEVEALRGVTVRHLLEHTHGLDDSLLTPPRQRHGLIDGEELLSRVAALQRWAAPGVAYSYGNAGAWLVAAALERLHCRAFGTFARDELLAPLGVVSAPSCDAPWLCAATGAGLTLTAEELVRFGLSALDERSLPAAARVTPLPGWHPLERGVCLGWKYAGAGWFGHQSVWPRASIYFRVQPQRKLALAVVACEQAAALVAIGVFGARLPELFEQRSKLPGGRVSTDARRAAGVYEQAARVVAIEPTPHGLFASAWERDDGGRRRGTPTRALLVPTRGVLFAQPATELVPYVELIPGPTGAAWLWNGRTVLRRATAQRSVRR
jgi:CubicO group peptidase (beta-lactamase class C family)